MFVSGFLPFFPLFLFYFFYFSCWVLLVSGALHLELGGSRTKLPHRQTMPNRGGGLLSNCVESSRMPYFAVVAAGVRKRPAKIANKK